MLVHPDGYTAGAKALQQAIAAVMDTEKTIVDYTRKPENRELKRAIEKREYIERPKSPWLRVAPKFHPRKMDV